MSHRIHTRAFSVALVVAIFLPPAVNQLAAAEEKPKPTEKITYVDHVQPILREHCFACHNQNESKSDLALDSYAALIEGGASGEVVSPGEPGDSRLWLLISHEEEPKMPPGQDKLPQAKLDLVRSWIEKGALENSGSIAKKPKESALALKASDGSKRPEGPVAMPVGVLKQPVVASGRAAAVSTLATSPWAPLAAVPGQRQISLYHTDTGALLGVLPFVAGVPEVLEFSRDGSLLIAGGGRGAQRGLVAVYDVRTGRRLLSVGDELDTVLAASINPAQSQIALGGPQKLVRVYSTADGSLLHEINSHTDWITAIRYSPDGKWLATADRAGGAFVWEADTVREHLRPQDHKQAITSLGWRPDSQVLAAAGMDGTIRLWEMKDGRQIKNWGAHGGGAQSVHFHHDGRIVTAGRDRVVKVWDASGKHLGDIARCSDIGLAACFTHDGKRVIAGDWGGQVRMWDVATKKLAQSLPANPPTLAARASATAARVAELTDASRNAQAAAATAASEIKSLETQIASLVEADKLAQSSVELAQSQIASVEKELTEKTPAEKAPAEKAPVEKDAAEKPKAGAEAPSPDPAATSPATQAPSADVAAHREQLEKAKALAASAGAKLGERRKQLEEAKKNASEKDAGAKRLQQELVAAIAAADAAMTDQRLYEAAAEQLAHAVEAAQVRAQSADALYQQAEQLRQTAAAKDEQVRKQLAAVEAEYQRLKKQATQTRQRRDQLAARAQQTSQASSGARAAVDQAAMQKTDFEAAEKIRRESTPRQTAGK